MIDMGLFRCFSYCILLAGCVCQHKLWLGSSPQMRVAITTITPPPPVLMSQTTGKQENRSANKSVRTVRTVGLFLY